MLSSASKKFNSVFKNYFELYKRECKRLFISKCNWFKNQLMSNKSSSKNISREYDPGFLWKGTATKVWKDLVLEGLSLQDNWQRGNYIHTYFDNKIIKYLGETLLSILRNPDLTVPALIKHDPNVDLHSVYSQYLYEYLFRMKNLYAGKRPAATFTFLSEKEVAMKKGLLNINGVNSSEYYDALAKEIQANNENQLFFNLRWYCSSPKFSTYSDNSSYASTQFTTGLVEVLRMKEAKSELVSLLSTIHDTITFHWKLSFEAIADIEDDLRFLQEYDKRWNAFVASMI